MDNDYRLIAEAIRRIAGTFDISPVSVFSGEVVAGSIDEAKRTCTVSVVIGTETTNYEDVSFSAEGNDGLIQVPKEGSSVICGKMPTGEVYIFVFSEVDAVILFIDGSNKFRFDSNGWVWNAGSFGGMAKTGALAAQLSTIEESLNLILVAISGIIVAGGGSPATTVTNGTLSGFFAGVDITPLTITTQASIEDTKIKH